MIENFNLATEYSRKLFKIEDERIIQIEKESLDENVPIITREVLNYMLFEAKRINSKNILEIGTATGYSGIFLAQIANRNNGELTTIEIDNKRHEKAVLNFSKMELLDKNILLEGDALEILPKLLLENKKYDFIFIDASKGQYEKFFNYSYELLNEKGLIFIDNILFRGMVCEETITNKRYKTIIKNLNNFIKKLNEEYNSVLLPFGDGCSIVYKA